MKHWIWIKGWNENGLLLEKKIYFWILDWKETWRKEDEPEQEFKGFDEQLRNGGND